MVISSKLKARSQVKSTRLPCTSHSSLYRIELELNATKTIVAETNPSAETICSGLSQIAKLYKCMSTDILNSYDTQFLISRDQNKKWVEELINKSLTYLDVCGSTRDMVIQFKEHTRDLQCALRRKKCENEIMKYKRFRKKMKKDVKLLIAGLKPIDNMITSGESKVVDSDSHQVAVATVMKEVSEMTVSVFASLLVYISTPISKPNRWSSVVSKFIHKGVVACEDQQAHEIINIFESIDSGLQTLCKNGSTQGEKMQIAKGRLERQETLLDCMETRLECIFRCMIETRASLLNIKSLPYAYVIQVFTPIVELYEDIMV